MTYTIHPLFISIGNIFKYFRIKCMIEKLDRSYFLKEEKNKLGEIISEPGVILLNIRNRNTATRYLLLRPETDGWIAFCLHGEPEYPPFKVRAREILDSYMEKTVFIPYTAKIWEDLTSQNRILEPTEETKQLANTKLEDIKEREQFKQHRHTIGTSPSKHIRGRSKEQLTTLQDLEKKLQKDRRYYNSLPADHKDSLVTETNLTSDEICEWVGPGKVSYEAACFYIVTKTKDSIQKKFECLMELVEKYRTPNHTIEYFLLSMVPIKVIYVLTYIYFAYQTWTDRSKSFTLLNQTLPIGLQVELSKNEKVNSFVSYLQQNKIPNERVYSDESKVDYVTQKLTEFAN